MKRIILAAVAVCAIAGAALAADVFSDLHITPADAKQAVNGALTSGLPGSVFGAAAFKAASPATRVAIVNAGVAWVKSYAGSPEFKQAYLQMRDRIKPQPPVFKGTPEDELKADAPKDPAKDPDTQKMLASLPPDQRTQMEETMKNVSAMIAQSQTPQAQQMRLQAIKADRANKTQQYQTDLARWSKEYPEDPKPLLIRRLHEFLDVSADIDFSAQTNGPNRTGSFLNPAFESKPDRWKLCFRAGKEATMTARTAVQAWLKELGG
ncbi:MAG TPA: hypothetical protein VGL62_03110 [Vicinamibacterales bacterium]